MTDFSSWNSIGTLTLVHVLIQIGLVVRVLLRPHREPASRIAWIVVIVAVPIVGFMAYLLLGETSIGRGRIARRRKVLEQMPDAAKILAPQQPTLAPDVPSRFEQLSRLGYSVNAFEPIAGNRGNVMADSNATIESLVADIDAAQDHVHLLFYIWLPDNNGCKIVAALIRAAKRGVTCRAMVDGLGSRMMISSEHWQTMQAAEVNVATALPIGNPLLRPFRGRIDLRNHRKIVVIDNEITYCGSQNCADPEFRIKAKYAPWVDVMLRIEGPIARYNQHLFAGDWMAQVDDDIDDLLMKPISQAQPGFTAQVIGTGPTIRNSAMPEIFTSMIYSARHELVITTPYFVPDESMQAALCASGRRGVETTIIFPARNDSWVVAAASRSYYADLLDAGVRIFEYQDGLLHAKSLTIDREAALIGSANMDRRSLELNYENNILLYDTRLTADLRDRQQSYLAHSKPITLVDVGNWHWTRRLANNVVAMLGPVL